jgi:hypothetical protein
LDTKSIITKAFITQLVYVGASCPNMTPKVKGKKWILVDDDVHGQLKALGRKDETYSNIIRRLLKAIGGKSNE